MATIRGGLRSAGVDGTGAVDLNSDLERRKWLMEGLIQKQSESFFAPFKGSSSDSVIYQVNDFNKGGTSNTVVFDYSGNLSGRPVIGLDTAVGKGEQKRKFSDKLYTNVIRYVVDNGTKFNGFSIGDDAINEHSDSVNKLGDLYIRATDQACFDVLQQKTEFGLNIGNAFNMDQFLRVEEAIKYGRGYDTHPANIITRTPLKPFKMMGGREYFLVLCDTAAKNMLLKSTGMQDILVNSDVRGNENRVIKGVLGTIGNFMFIEAPSFFGYSSGQLVDDEGYYNFDSTSVEISGLRQRDVAGKWTGEEGFSLQGDLFSRMIVLGKNALQVGISKYPEYHYEEHDFAIRSESCLETWMGIKLAKYKAENSDYDMAKLAGYAYGSIALDVQVK